MGAVYTGGGCEVGAVYTGEGVKWEQSIQGRV